MTRISILAAAAFAARSSIAAGAAAAISRLDCRSNRAHGLPS